MIGVVRRSGVSVRRIESDKSEGVESDRERVDIQLKGGGGWKEVTLTKTFLVH